MKCDKDVVYCVTINAKTRSTLTETVGNIFNPNGC